MPMAGVPGNLGFDANTGALIVTSIGAGASGGSPTDRGGTITTGGTQQTLAAANTSRKSLVIQNPPDATEILYVAVSGNATVGGAGNYAALAAGGQCVISSTGAVSVNAATTSHRFLATEFS